MALPPPPKFKRAALSATGPILKIARLKLADNPRVWNWIIVQMVDGREELIASGKNYATSEGEAMSNFRTFQHALSSL